MVNLNKIKIDSYRLAEWRKLRGFTQETFANNFPFSTRTLQRFEDPSNETYLSFSEISKIAKHLNVHGYQIWSELPRRQLIYGQLINSAKSFAEIFNRSIILRSKFSVLYAPDDPEIEKALLRLSKLFETETNRKWDDTKIRNNLKDLEENFEIRDLFRTITSQYRTDQASVYVYSYGIAKQTGDFDYEWNTKWDIEINRKNNENISRWFDTTDKVIGHQVSEDGEYEYYFDFEDYFYEGSSPEEIEIKLKDYIELVLRCRPRPSINKIAVEEVDDFNQFKQDDEIKENSSD